MRHWLVKSEPSSYSIDDLKRDRRTAWTGVRNHQARNFMREMQVGDLLLFYHSNGDPSGVAGVARVAKLAYPDATAFDRRDPHFDPKSNPEKPTWLNVDVAFVRKLRRTVSLEELKAEPRLEGMLLLSGKAPRLSVQPVGAKDFEAILALAGR